MIVQEANCPENRGRVKWAAEGSAHPLSLRWVLDGALSEEIDLVVGAGTNAIGCLAFSAEGGKAMLASLRRIPLPVGEWRVTVRLEADGYLPLRRHILLRWRAISRKENRYDLEFIELRFPDFVEKGYTDYEEDAKQLGNKFPKLIAPVTKRTAQMGTAMRGARVGSSARENYRRMARIIDSYCSFVERKWPQAQSIGDQLTDSWLGILRLYPAGEDALVLSDLKESVEELQRGIQVGRDGLQALRDVAWRERRKLHQQDLNRAIDRLDTLLDGQISFFDGMMETSNNLLGMIAGRRRRLR